MPRGKTKKINNVENATNYINEILDILYDEQTNFAHENSYLKICDKLKELGKIKTTNNKYEDDYVEIMLMEKKHLNKAHHDVILMYSDEKCKRLKIEHKWKRFKKEHNIVE